MPINSYNFQRKLAFILTIINITILCLYAESFGSLRHHQGSSWSHEQLLTVHLNFINSEFNFKRNTTKINSIQQTIK
ncbi:unnamed protein product [Rotaria magnacalcarata]